MGNTSVVSQQDQSVRQVLEEVIKRTTDLHFLLPRRSNTGGGIAPSKGLEKLLVRGFEQVIVPSIQSLLQSVS